MSVRQLSAVQIARRHVRLAAVPGFLVLGAIAGWWTWRALHDPRGWDLGLAYRAGQVAWFTGHPERVPTWDGTPLLAFAMGATSRLLSRIHTQNLLTCLNLVLVLVTVGEALRRLRLVLSPVGWWVTAFALLSFGPILSTVWFKQFNIIALSLAIAAFDQLRRGRESLSAGLLGLSVAVKPLVFLLPLVLLCRKQTRRMGAIAIGWIIALNFGALALIAIKLGHIGLLNPYVPLHNFAFKSRFVNIWACHAENFAPGSLLCRLAGPGYETLQHFVVLGAVAVMGLWAIEALRGHSARSWELFAFTLPLSVMLSPLAWSHYQIVLAPLLVLLLVRFTRGGAGVGSWTGLAVGFLLCCLFWRPYGTSVGAIRTLISGHVETTQDLFSVAALAQFAQYVLLLTGILWYAQRRRVVPPGEELGNGAQGGPASAMSVARR